MTTSADAPQTAGYGAWKSPIGSGMVVADAVRLGQLAVSGDAVYWLEGRPQDGGRNVVVRRSADGATADLTPAPFNVRTRVHEYGGGAYLVDGDTLYFCNFADQHLYRQPAGRAPERMSVRDGMRYADAAVDRVRRRLALVREDHTAPGREAVNTLAAIGLDAPYAETVLCAGADFYSSPRLSPDGSRLAWLSWNHPNMPWDGCDLWLAELGADGRPGEPRHVAGGPQESIFQPEWSPAGELVFASDRSGWWNLYRWRGGRSEPLLPMSAEFGEPQWVFGMSDYVFDDAGRIVARYQAGGESHLALLDTDSGSFRELPTPYRSIGGLRAVPGGVVFLGGAPAEPNSVVRLDLASLQCQVLRRASTARIDAGYLSVPQPIEFPAAGGLSAHAFYYPPQNRDFRAPAGARPPLLVLNHGGPTAATEATLNPLIQFWTSRGFAVADVNYGGSSGYGRAYRGRLIGQWGVVDVEDAINVARHLVQRGLADEQRLAIRGGSAGGFTALAALTFHRYFKAGASYYGVGDLEALARDTHKFESRYLDSLVGAYPAQKALYEARSPLRHVERLRSPLILFQGLEDQVVPPNQSQTMFDAVKAKGLPVALLTFEHEQHGFRRAQTIRRCLEAELYFYGRLFGFTPADAIEPVAIENLP
ncbi:MAG: S9 family peptidase [Nevskia sp.]|nr:S9 family peptidase [Nevskia sp.]